MSDIKSKVSIIIPHWNNVDVLSECLDSISSTDYPNFEIIIVDNASNDNSVEWVKSNYPRVTLIENDKNNIKTFGNGIQTYKTLKNHILTLKSCIYTYKTVY